MRNDGNDDSYVKIVMIIMIMMMTTLIMMIMIIMMMIMMMIMTMMMAEVKNKGPSGKTTPKGWVKYMRQRAKWKAARQCKTQTW